MLALTLTCVGEPLRLSGSARRSVGRATAAVLITYRSTDCTRSPMTCSSRARLRNTVVLASAVGLLATFFVGQASAQFITVSNPVVTPARRHRDLQAHRRLLLHDGLRAGLQAGRAAPRHHAAGPGHRRHDQRVRRRRRAERSAAGSGRRTSVTTTAPGTCTSRRRPSTARVRPAAVLDPQHLRQPDDLLVERAAAVQHRLGVVPARPGVVRQPRRALLRLGAGQPATPTTTATCTSPG